MEFVLLIGVFVLLSCGILPLGFALLLFVAERRRPPDPGEASDGNRPAKPAARRDRQTAVTRLEPPAGRVVEPL